MRLMVKASDSPTFSSTGKHIRLAGFVHFEAQSTCMELVDLKVLCIRQGVIYWDDYGLAIGVWKAFSEPATTSCGLDAALLCICSCIQN
jgi:hypothetical protein